MKKTIISLFALASMPYADVDLTSPVVEKTATTGISNILLSDYSSTTITVAITLETTYLEKFIRGKNTGDNDKKQLISLWGDNMVSPIGLGMNNYSENNIITTGGIYLGGNTAGSNASGSTSMGDISTQLSDVAWGNADWAVLTWTFDKSGSQNAYMTYKIDGEISTISGSCTSSRNNTNITGIYFNNSYVTNVMAYEGIASSAQVQSIAKAIAVPEPTTATLSLLALCGLAARRRRK